MNYSLRKALVDDTALAMRQCSGCFKNRDTLIAEQLTSAEPQEKHLKKF